jgi:dTDP-4-dehydrorhamnose reductase
MALIVVTGANGQLGQEIKELSARLAGFDFVFLTREELDISSESTVNEVFRRLSPAYCINCAAYTAVDKAEIERHLAYAINAKGAENLAKAALKSNCKLLHISTDYVFDGNGTIPYKEDDSVDPVNSYGASKLEGERTALRINPDVIIIRTSWVYSFYGNNFVKTMLRLMVSKPGINVVSDQVGSPTYAADLADAILVIIEKDLWVPGVYHYSNEGAISWFEFATEIKKASGSHCVINPIPTQSYPTPAKRPSYSVLDKSKFLSTFHLPLSNWKDSLHKCLKRLSL